MIDVFLLFFWIQITKLAQAVEIPEIYATETGCQAKLEAYTARSKRHFAYCRRARLSVEDLGLINTQWNPGP